MTSPELLHHLKAQTTVTEQQLKQNKALADLPCNFFPDNEEDEGLTLAIWTPLPKGVPKQAGETTPPSTSFKAENVGAVTFINHSAQSHEVGTTVTQIH